MLRSLAILVLVAPSYAIAEACTCPFANTLADFQLSETLSCSQETSPVVLNIIPGNQSAAVVGKWEPVCDQYSPYFTLKDANAKVVGYTETMANALSRLVSFISCGNPSFEIDRTPLLLTLPSGQSVNAKIAIYAQDASKRALLGYVSEDEDKPNDITLRGPTTQILSQAHKAWGDCSARWEIQNTAASQISAHMISLLVTLKDNTGFSCLPKPAAFGLSHGAMFGLGTLTGVSFCAGVTALYCYIKYRVRPAQYNMVN